LFDKIDIYDTILVNKHLKIKKMRKIQNLNFGITVVILLVIFCATVKAQTMDEEEMGQVRPAYLPTCPFINNEGILYDHSISRIPRDSSIKNAIVFKSYEEFDDINYTMAIEDTTLPEGIFYGREENGYWSFASLPTLSFYDKEVDRKDYDITYIKIVDNATTIEVYRSFEWEGDRIVKMTPVFIFSPKQKTLVAAN
jgi:hypothetical protein